MSGRSCGGLEVQKRLRASQVLSIGMKGLGLKLPRIYRAGVKELTMLDHEQVSPERDHHHHRAPLWPAPPPSQSPAPAPSQNTPLAGSTTVTEHPSGIAPWCCLGDAWQEQHASCCWSFLHPSGLSPFRRSTERRRPSAGV